MSAETILTDSFATLPELIRAHAAGRGQKAAVVCGDQWLTYAELDRGMDRVAAALQRDGIPRGSAIAIASASSIEYAQVFLGAIRAGCVAAPLQPSATPEQLAAMVADCAAPILFHDAASAGIETGARKIALDGPAFAAWLSDATPAPVILAPGDPFNIIYSSGTTGTPKGIVQSHAMRWQHIVRAPPSFAEAVTMIATPLYSNTTLVSFLPTLAWGGTAVLLPKFDARAYVIMAEKHRATHAMLVPVQYQRIMALPDFDSFDLSSFQFKSCTSAPFSPALKADIIARWPGALIEYYGLTEGGGTCVLVCNMFPDKLHTVGRPVEGHDIRLIDEDGCEVGLGGAGEVVGRSPAMMSGYHGRSDATSSATWHDAEGNAFIRHGDVGRFDPDGFLILMDRKKDMIISGGFNIYPSDLEAILIGHPQVKDCAVVGVPSEQWGETPVGFYAGDGDAPAILEWFNAQVGKTQRLTALEKVDELPRSAIGKVLKRELRDRYLA
ncbi:class I adenylate-forming enzyme family protein [Sphingomonas sp. AOB5]|uniref:class I adenylate-forming enzyme family protein n=1 Tax=Sphingomonas sp. AOB5 TaxID=3034017 RepID=UPI0023F727A6|nr:class I adenylate-forming enzyme family protein [Sphingomonas sp. AOB5]MDF7773817.1 class I adenylate-forming enzyme family protein [Sphingomonas sp. AOB5]